jgi:hypothetical protein
MDRPRVVSRPGTVTWKERKKRRKNNQQNSNQITRQIQYNKQDTIKNTWGQTKDNRKKKKNKLTRYEVRRVGRRTSNGQILQSRIQKDQAWILGKESAFLTECLQPKHFIRDTDDLEGHGLLQGLDPMQRVQLAIPPIRAL